MTKLKENVSRRVFVAFNTVIFFLLCLIFVYPLWYVFIQSLSSGVSTNAALLPNGFTLNNYANMLTLNTIVTAALVSIARTVVGVVFTVTACMFGGYIFTKPMPGRTFLYRFVIITMYVSGGLVPTYIVFSYYGLLNNFWVYVIPLMVNVYYMILIKTYIEQLPASVEESAMIDGAGTMTIFFRIVLPMSMPIVATIAIFTAVSQWNAWFDNYIYTSRSPELTTLQYLLYTYLTQGTKLMELMEQTGANIDLSNLLTPWTIRMTVTMVTVLPILLVYPFLQRYFVKGIVIGAVKG
jgi:multiple sugar transport system permease protein/putative aldouronate transport system permease protein